MTSEFVKAAIAGIYEQASRSIGACRDKGARDWITSEAGRAVKEVSQLEDIPISSTGKPAKAIESREGR